MPIYVTLIKATPENWKTVKEMPKRWDATRKAIKTAGGKVLGCWATMGQYDYVLVAEYPDNSAALKVLVETAARGTVILETLSATPIEEFAATVKSL